MEDISTPAPARSRPCRAFNAIAFCRMFPHIGAANGLGPLCFSPGVTADSWAFYNWAKRLRARFSGRLSAHQKGTPGSSWPAGYKAGLDAFRHWGGQQVARLGKLLKARQVRCNAFQQEIHRAVQHMAFAAQAASAAFFLERRLDQFSAWLASPDHRQNTCTRNRVRAHYVGMIASDIGRFPRGSDRRKHGGAEMPTRFANSTFVMRPSACNSA